MHIYLGPLFDTHPTILVFWYTPLPLLIQMELLFRRTLIHTWYMKASQRPGKWKNLIGYFRSTSTLFKLKMTLNMERVLYLNTKRTSPLKPKESKHKRYESNRFRSNLPQIKTNVYKCSLKDLFWNVANH